MNSVLCCLFFDLTVLFTVVPFVHNGKMVKIQVSVVRRQVQLVLFSEKDKSARRLANTKVLLFIIRVKPELFFLKKILVRLE